MTSDSEDEEYQEYLGQNVFFETGQSPLTAACLDGKKNLVACPKNNVITSIFILVVHFHSCEL